jgi:glycosyltransferase involved in cell wall biosynthesis
MRILHIMFGKKLGLIEQAFLEFNHAMNIQKIDVVPVVHPKSLTRKYINGNYYTVSHFTSFDPFAILKIRKLVLEVQPNLIITHTEKTNKLIRSAIKNVPIVTVVHDDKYKPVMQSDAIIVQTEKLKREIVDAGKESSSVFVVPHIIRMSPDITYTKPRAFTTPVIATLARLNKVDGADLFLKSLATLVKEGVNFTAKIAGDGSERKKIESLAQKLGLQDKIEFLHHIDDKDAFFRDVDIFCFPSQSESFGLALIEAMIHSKPIITTTAGMACQIAIDGENCLVIEKKDTNALCTAIRKIIDNEKLRVHLSKEAFFTAQEYSIYNVSRTLKLALEDIYYNAINSRYKDF